MRRMIMSVVLVVVGLVAIVWFVGVYNDWVYEKIATQVGSSWIDEQECEASREVLVKYQNRSSQERLLESIVWEMNSYPGCFTKAEIEQTVTRWHTLRGESLIQYAEECRSSVENMSRLLEDWMQEDPIYTDADGGSFHPMDSAQAVPAPQCLHRLNLGRAYALSCSTKAGDFLEAIGRMESLPSGQEKEHLWRTIVLRYYLRRYSGELDEHRIDFERDYPLETAWTIESFVVK